MNNQHILNTLQRSSALLKQDFNENNLQEFSSTYRDYDSDNVQDFKRDLIEAGNRLRIIYLDNQLDENPFYGFISEVEIPIVAFALIEGKKYPVIFYSEKGKRYFEVIGEKSSSSTQLTDENWPDLYKDESGKVLFLGVFSYKSLVSDDPDEGENVKPYTPFKRLIRLLAEEKKDISYIYVYAVFIGIISLSLPLGIQAVVSLISGGVFFSSVYVLISLVIIGVLVGGGLQVMQVTLVEYLQRRVFIKAAFEFAFRVPRIKAEALLKHHAPELMNRFFDVLTIQKGLPKLLIDLSSGVIQIIFGLLLLSFYHPFFVFFGLFLLAALGGIFYATGNKGLSSSIKESKYKYQVVHWLEELARTINSFKLSGNTSLPMKRTDTNANNYLKYRKAHFSILIQQYSFIVLFKALVIGGVLIIGTILVVQREITLGQFVASEVIIILIVSSVEKIIMYMDVVYDVLTAVDKISQVTDLPLERSGGLTFPKGFNGGFEIKAKGLSYKFKDNHDYTLRKIDLLIKKGERVCIAGSGGSGKTVLTNVISGLLTDFQGAVTINNFSVRDLDLNNLRDRVGKNVSQEDIFEGTILDNVLLAKPYAKPEDAIWALEKVGALDDVNAMPQGLDTPVISGGKGLPSSLVNRLILARCLAKHPSLLILNDFFSGFSRPERMALMTMLIQPENPWTMWVVSNDPLVMAACDRIIVLSKGKLAAQGTFDELANNGALKDILN
ncbi:ABC transporter ATP-binding protein/permease [Fulvivirga ulvae]|uniref:peptidase domain-containing ABC transporter n=1 Tax=Fulvivirga ulvae TaxID=2904245 RepID=UPI001F46DA81|nr:ABC transporter ATP-binding protein [Fulvivirga ulvae]UII29820.1 ABC transporter ATP-binding protein/permease [Fulvivirga ulvae]